MTGLASTAGPGCHATAVTGFERSLGGCSLVGEMSIIGMSSSCSFPPGTSGVAGFIEGVVRFDDGPGVNVVVVRIAEIGEASVISAMIVSVSDLSVLVVAALPMLLAPLRLPPHPYLSSFDVNVVVALS